MSHAENEGFITAVHSLMMVLHQRIKIGRKIRVPRLARVSSILLIASLLTVPSALAGGQPFVLHGTFEQPDSSPSPQQSHGVVGLELRILNGHYPVVDSVFRGTPAARQGMLPGDVVMAINSVSTLGKTVSQVDQMISDVPGDTVMITLQRGGHLSHIKLIVASLEDLPAFSRSNFSYLWSPTP